MSYVLGIDLGTSSLKGIILNRQGEIVNVESSEYSVENPKSGYREQNPKIWINAFEIVMEKLILKNPEILDNLENISFSGQMHSLVLLDKNNNVIRNAILWNDVRTTKECDFIMKNFREEIISITKNKALEGFTLPKILWVQKNEPENWKLVKNFLLPKDYLGFYLTNNIQMEFSDGAGTLLMDVEKKQWDFELAEKFNIPKNIFPKLVKSTDFIGNLKPELIKKFGFKKDVKIIAGGADNACGAIGAGIIEEGIGMCSIGTSGVFLAFEEDKNKNYNGELHFFNHGIEDSFYSMGVTLSAGDSLLWFKNNFFENNSFDEMLDEIKNISIGSDGLIFAPYIGGERTPYTDSKIRGSFIGIDNSHTKNNFVKSIVEGITFSLKDSQEIMFRNNKDFNKIVSVGGGAKNKAWLQIQADIFDCNILVLETEQGPGMGACILASVGAGWYDSIKDAVKNIVKYKEEFKPIKENVEKYKKVYKIYTKIYYSTQNICNDLQNLK